MRLDKNDGTGNFAADIPFSAIFLEGMNRLFFKPTLLVFIALAGSCSEGDSNSKVLEGRWKATWQTSYEAFPGVGNEVSLTMDGWIDFNNDQVTVTAYGYPGCIFSSDTLRHSQKWLLKNDTLELINEGDLHGISYYLKHMSKDTVELVLMGDIFLRLSRAAESAGS